MLMGLNADGIYRHTGLQAPFYYFLIFVRGIKVID